MALPFCKQCSCILPQQRKGLFGYSSWRGGGGRSPQQALIQNSGRNCQILCLQSYLSFYTAPQEQLFQFEVPSFVLARFFFMLLFRFTSFQCCFLWTRKFETNIPSALAVNIVTAFWRELQNNISGSSLLFLLRRKNWTPASLSRSLLCWMKLLGNTQGPKQECTCWAFAYSSKLLLARLSALRRWAASAHSAHILGFLLLPGSVSMAFPPSPPTRIYSKWY